MVPIRTVRPDGGGRAAAGNCDGATGTVPTNGAVDRGTGTGPGRRASFPQTGRPMLPPGDCRGLAGKATAAGGTLAVERRQQDATARRC